MKSTYSLLIVILSVLCLFSCKREAVQQSKIDYEKFNDYITKYPSGPISRCSDLSIDLGFTVPQGTLPVGLIDVTPPMGGNYQLSSNGRRVKLVNAEIKHNVTYTVDFNIGLLTEMPAGLETFTFPIEAQRQTLDIVMDPPINQSMEQVSYSGEVKYGMCEPTQELVEECLKATQDGKQLAITWRHASSRSSSQFVIQNIARKSTPGIVDLDLSMEPYNVDDRSSMQLAVPSQSEFSVHGTELRNGVKLLNVIFTDPILADQKLEGLINVKGRTVQQFKVINNTVQVFFKDESYGYHDLEVLPGIKNIAGHPLKGNFEQELFFQPPLPNVAIAEKGNILPPDNQWKLPVKLITANGFRLRVLKIYDENVINLYQGAEDVYDSQTGLEKIGRIVLDTIYTFDKENPYLESYHSITLDRLVKRESGALYKIFLTIPREYIAYPCKSIPDNVLKDQVDNINFDQPRSSMRYGYDIHYTEHPSQVNGDPCRDYYIAKIHDSRLLMCSDIGVVAKWEPDAKSYFFYVSQITTANPIGGAHLQLYNYQGREVFSDNTDGNGISNLPVGDVKARLLKVSSGNDVTYLELEDARALSLSTFQIEGKNWNGQRKIYFYGERDVWRPGDTIYLNAMVYQPDNPLPPALPVNIKLFDPTNKLVKTWVEKSHADGIYNCHFGTDLNAPTGRWRVELSLGGQSYRTTVRVETIRPNRLKMEMEFSDEKVIKHDGDLDAPLTVKWMHGLEAKELKTEISMFQKSLTNPFSADYKNYSFNDIKKRYDRDQGMIVSKSTNSKGVLDFDIPIEQRNYYPSMMLFNFELRAFEKGGAFSTDMKSIRYSPYSHYVGAKFPGGDNGSEIYIKDDQAIMLASLDEEGKPVSRKVNVTLTKIEHSWWYQFGNRGNYAALSSSLQSIKKEYDVTVGPGGKAISIDLYGRYLLTVKDIESGHQMSRVIYSYGESWSDEGGEVSQLEVLPFHLEETEYNVGDNLSFDLPPMSNGRYLVSIESGGKIVHTETRQTSLSPSQVNINVVPEMSPTAYVHVHLIQAWNTHLNDRPLRLFGVKPIKVLDPNTILSPQLEMPDALQTDEQFSVTVSETNNQPMSYTLAIVDEGLLDITQYRTPDPWSAFFGKEGLQVKTWDMYRDIFHRFLGEYTSLLAVGGDGSNAINASAKARRFKPVVKHLGPYTLDPGETATHELAINNYAGSVRAMIVGTNGMAVGRYEKTVPVKKPLMLYATLPRVMGPEEKMKLPVTVFSMEQSIKTVTAKITTDSLVRVVGSDTQEVVFEKEGEQDITFEVETVAGIGVTTVDVEVKSGQHYFKETIELDLRPSAPVVTQSFNSLIDPQSTKTVSYQPIGMPGTQSGKVTVSKGLNFSFGPHVDWLTRYPHGCLEQTISSVFPQIYLYQMNLLDDGDDKMKYRQHFAAVIQKLRFLQLPSGGFSYWPGGNIANDYGTSYAFEFLLEAKKLGYSVPQDMIDNCIQYQYKTATNPIIQSRTGNRSTSDRRTIALAYKLYTLAQAGKPNYAAMNRLRLVPQLHNTGKWILAHTFMTIGEKDLAELMRSSATQSTEDYKELSGSFGSSLRDQAIIARVLTEMGEKEDAKRLIDEIADQFNQDNRYQYSTQERAQALITFSRFVGDLGKVEDTLSYDIQFSGDLLQDQQLAFAPHEYVIAEHEMAESVKVVNKSDSNLYTTVVMSGQSLRDDSKQSEQDLSVDVTYSDEDGNEIDPKTLQKGQDFKVSYTVVHPGVREDYQNMALTAILPSGWEILNQRMKQNSTFDEGDTADYSDIRDDRILLYFDLKKGSKKTFNFMFNATYEGNYWAAPVFCEAMYDASIYAKQTGYWAIVK